MLTLIQSAKSTLTFFICFIQFANASSQDVPDVQNKHLVFLELGGPGFGASINYQKKIIRSNYNNGLFFRGGFGALGPIPGRNGGALFLSIPLGFHYSFTKASKFEIGAGCTPYTFTNGNLSVAGFASFAFYPFKKHDVRLLFSPFIHNRSVLKYYLNANSNIFLYGGIDFLFPLKKRL